MKRILICVAVFVHMCLLAGTQTYAEDNRKILVEIYLPRDRKGDLEKIKKEFTALSITRIRAQFFYPAGTPLRNIAIGDKVPADVARVAIRLAVTSNQGVRYLLQQFRLPSHYIAIGTSAFDETAQIPIDPQDLEKLSDPSLTTPQFHALYRQLTEE